MNQNKIDPVFHFVITTELSNQRIDKALASHPLIQTRSRATFLIENSFVTINNKTIKPSYKTKLDDTFTITLPNKVESSLDPYDLKLDILHEDNELIVLNKPAGLVVHPSLGHHNKTLVNALIHHTKDLSMGFQEHRPGIVHRLDRETSGLLVVAKNDFVHENLAKQFKNRSVHRIYWALVFGTPRERVKKITSSLGRHPTQRQKFAAVKTGGKLSVTNYEVLKTALGISHLKIKLETGRTHQIRVHLSELGHPIVGDQIYGGSRKLQTLVNPNLKFIVSQMCRIALHAKELGFIHPKTRKELFFDSTWPQDLVNLIEATVGT